MNFETCYTTSSAILMEGAIGERLKREFGIPFDDTIALAGHIYNAASKKAMLDIFGQYLSIAEKYRLPFMATTPTRRANRERVRRSKYSETIIHDNVRFLLDIKSKAQTPMFIGGLMGCKGDAYKATDVLSEKDALEFHSWQAGLFTKAGVDFLYAAIMPALSESIGMAKALENTGLPYIISFMIRNNGRLVDGTIIHDAIAAIDSATVKKPICYMTNCVHPTTLKDALTCSFNRTDLVKDRFRGIQANTSMLPPEELDICNDLISSDCVSLAHAMMDLYNHCSPKIFGGCCGTDNTHIEEIAKRLRVMTTDSGQ